MPVPKGAFPVIYQHEEIVAGIARAEKMKLIATLRLRADKLYRDLREKHGGPGPIPYEEFAKVEALWDAARDIEDEVK